MQKIVNSECKILSRKILQHVLLPLSRNFHLKTKTLFTYYLCISYVLAFSVYIINIQRCRKPPKCFILLNLYRVYTFKTLRIADLRFKTITRVKLLINQSTEFKQYQKNIFQYFYFLPHVVDRHILKL